MSRQSRAFPPIHSTGPNSDDNAPIRLWLCTVAALILLIVMVGGATRLTGSGLSITEWRPLIGAIPPLSQADWLDAFEKYKQIPEYQRINKGMSLDAFKVIFWWEWSHRFLGRLIGVVFAVPLLVFWMRGRLPAGLAPKLMMLLVLGGLQGAMGWYMVKSGLVDRVDVSQYRLAAHLGIAVVILGLVVWIVFDLAAGPRGIHLSTVTGSQRTMAAALVALIFMQIMLGAIVAGIKAGLTYNTWPLMDGRLVPEGLDTLSPLYLNLFENPTAVQFNHRLMAYVLVVMAIYHAVDIGRHADDARLRRGAWLLAGAVLSQAALGIWTLLAWVPLALALLHQAVAMLVFVVAVANLHALRQAT